MELAVQYRGERPRAGESRYDLVLLDAGTGRRRLLAGDVAWAPPRWSADGQRVRFEQRVPAGGFALREVDVETGAIEDTSDGEPDGSSLPGYSDLARVSPAGRWIAYRHEAGILCVARADGSGAFALRLWPRYLAATPHWSPCGTKLAADLTPESGGGLFVIDLRTGEPRGVSPGPGARADGWPSFHAGGWSPDGSRVVATRSRWHDPDTYDYEVHDVWLLDGGGATAGQPLTGDGRCRNAAIRPTGVGPANGEHELTFAWADRLDSAAGDALAARFLVNPEMDPPFSVVLTIRTDHGLVHSTMTGFRTVPAGFERIDAFLDANNHRPAAGFTVGFPRYATDDPTILRIAHLVAAEASKRLWRFDRDAFRH